MRKPFIEAESFDQLFLAIFGKGKKMVRQGIPDADVYVCLTFSAQELPDLQTLFAAEQETKPVILFNLKLDTQRGDLGLPAFPPKSLQWGFLSRVKPAYYLRTRQYSLSLPQPPFVINYQGAIFRGSSRVSVGRQSRGIIEFWEEFWSGILTVGSRALAVRASRVISRERAPTRRVRAVSVAFFFITLDRLRILERPWKNSLSTERFDVQKR